MIVDHQVTSLQKKCIFISHSNNEESVARLVKSLLLSSFVNQTIDVFLAEDIAVGFRWFDEIVRQLKRTDLVIGLFSPQSVVRPWVHIECGYAVVTGKTVLPLHYDGLTRDDIMAPYREIQSVDVSKREGALKLLEEVEKLDLKRIESKLLKNWELEFRRAHEQITEGDESRRGSRDFNWFFGIGDKTQKGVAILQDTKGRDFRIRTHQDVGRRSSRKIRCGTQNRDNIIVFNDMAAQNALNRLFAKFDTEFKICYDTHAYQLMDFATDFAIGLHNGVGHRICNRSDGLVELRLEGSAIPERRTKSKSAFPEFRVADEWFNHSRTNGEDDKQQKALILRIVDGRTGRVSFVCGGFDGQGTAAAGIFLGRHWRFIAKMLRDKQCENHCAAVVIKFDRTDPFDGPANLFKLVCRFGSRTIELT